MYGKTVKEEISRRISRPSFDTWFARLSGRVEGDQHLIVQASNAFQRDWITDRYQKLFQDVLEELTKQEFTLEIICEEKNLFLEDKVEKINQEAALGYMLLACKDVQLTAEQLAQLHTTMKKSFDSHTIKEAEREHMDYKRA